MNLDLCTCSGRMRRGWIRMQGQMSALACLNSSHRVAPAKRLPGAPKPGLLRLLCLVWGLCHSGILSVCHDTHVYDILTWGDLAILNLSQLAVCIPAATPASTQLFSLGLNGSVEYLRCAALRCASACIYHGTRTPLLVPLVSSVMTEVVSHCTGGRWHRQRSTRGERTACRQTSGPTMCPCPPAPSTRPTCHCCRQGFSSPQTCDIHPKGGVVIAPRHVTSTPKWM